jgi:hypothetical protein
MSGWLTPKLVSAGKLWTFPCAAHRREEVKHQKSGFKSATPLLPNHGTDMRVQTSSWALRPVVG